MIERGAWRTLLSPIGEYLRVEAGVVVEDRENQQRLLVISEQNDPADECHIEAIDMTVAEANPQYPHDDDVFVGVYLEELEIGEVETNTPRSVARDVKRLGKWKEYHFPRSRLDPVAPDRVTIGDFDESGGDR